MFNLFKKNNNKVGLTLSQKRNMMISALKEVLVPEINKMGFTGSFPHFRKKENEIMGFPSIQFNRYGGSFVLEVGKTKKEYLWGVEEETPFEKLHHGHTGYRRRIHPKEIKGDYWYSYEKFNNDNEFRELAKSIIPLLPQIEEFLQNGKFSHKDI